MPLILLIEWGATPMQQLSNNNPILEKLKQNARDSWKGQTGEDRAVRLEKCINRFTSEYAEAFNITADQVLEAIESKRNYSAINYYQDGKFPELKDIRIFDTQSEFLASIPSKQFRCPSCKAISKDPYTCNSGAEMSKGKICDWKSYGLFGCLGEGFTFTIKESFLEKPFIDTCFMPLEFEKDAV